MLTVGLVVGWAMLLPAALTLLGGEYALTLAAGDLPLDGRAPAFGAGLLVAAELGYWSLELRARVTEEAGGHARRAAWIALVALGGLLLGAALLALVDRAGQEGVALEAVGALAAVAGAVLLLVSLQPGRSRGGAGGEADASGPEPETR